MLKARADDAWRASLNLPPPRPIFETRIESYGIGGFALNRRDGVVPVEKILIKTDRRAGRLVRGPR